MLIKSLEKIPDYLEYLVLSACLVCSLSMYMYCVHHLVNMKLGSPAFKMHFCYRALAKNGDWVNKNLRWETIFLATSFGARRLIVSRELAC